MKRYSVILSRDYAHFWTSEVFVEASTPEDAAERACRLDPDTLEWDHEGGEEWIGSSYVNDVTADVSEEAKLNDMSFRKPNKTRSESAHDINMGRMYKITHKGASGKHAAVCFALVLLIALGAFGWWLVVR